MKTYFVKASLVVMMALVAFSSCSNDDDEFIGPSEVNDVAVAVPFFTINEDGQMPSAADQLIYEIRNQAPITAPDGHQLTWGEFSTVQGAADVQCKENGVQVALDLTGLIPNGVYTIWNAVFDEPGMDPTAEMLSVDGLGAAGIGDGTDNAFTASSSGTASITFTSPGGALSMLSNTDLGTCPLTDNFEWHVIGAYHMDNNTYGPLLGPDGTVVEQFGFIFKNDDN